MISKRIIIVLGMALCLVQGHAQNTKSKARQELEAFRREAHTELENFRRQAMDDFISFARQTWKEFGRKAPVKQPKEDFVIPQRVTPKPDPTKPKQEQLKEEQERKKQDEEMARLEQERKKQAKEMARLEQERKKQEQELARLEQERVKQEQEEARQEQERAKREQERARQEQERIKKNQAKQEQEQARQEQERIKKEKAKQEKELAQQEKERAKAEEEKAKQEQERIKREQERIRQEQEKAAREQERLRQEQERLKQEQEKAEQERIKQEKARQEKEKAKQEKEQAKQEKERMKAEQERMKAEQERIKAEQERIKREQEKAEHEQERLKQEQERLKREQEKAEQERIKAEQERIKKEEARQERERIKAEQEQAKAEQERIKAEQARIDAEQERAKKEQARQERERVKAEQERIKAENARVKAEQARIKQEQARIKQEQDRIRREQAKAEQERLKQEKPVKAHPVVIDEVVQPTPPEPQPQPVEPIEEVPVQEEQTIDFTFFGTHAHVRCNASLCPKLPVARDTEVADALTVLSSDRFDNLIVDCLKLRDDLHLSDWAYLLMLRAMAEAVAGEGTNGSVLLMAYVYMQSGYKMRLASDGQKLFMLYASKHTIYEQGAFEVDGDLYYGIDGLPEKMYICQASFPREKGLSLYVNSNQQLECRPSEERTITSKAFPDVQLNTSVNLNLIDFYNTYPTSNVGGNLMTRWAMYANTPLDSLVETKIKAELGPKLKGLSEKDAVERLLNLVQTGLEYEYDTKVWGHDRAFFAEESVYYPYADCEDRSIFLSRLVRDLLGLKCVLIYYPRHLAMAVHFTERVNGDVIYLDNVDYVVCDPTFISGAPVGRTMPDVDNSTAKAILLK
jgi:hypothetical protein